ncbi:lipoprotein [Micromonospora sp. NPDC047134]|uniref:lipoprotein n=1 Tax=Micromonospora sp. NPDC047134 TaxID=3154340 RepID=UPI0033EC2A35
MGRSRFVLAALAIGLLAGCGGGEQTDSGEQPGGSATGAPWHDEVASATASGKVGAGAPCPLPVTFELADGWRAKEIKTADPGDEVAAAVAEALTRRGGSTVRCEVDGRAVVSGFLRVWTADDADLPVRQALEAFVAADGKVTDPQYRQTQVGGLEVVEASWLSHRELLDEDIREWALAVRTGAATVLLEASSTSFGDPLDVLPAYRLARDTLTAAP